MAGRGRGIDMTRPAWMTEGSAPGVAKTNGNVPSIDNMGNGGLQLSAPGAARSSAAPPQVPAQQPLQQPSGWRVAPPVTPQVVQHPVGQILQRPPGTASVPEQRPIMPQMQIPGRPPGAPHPGLPGQCGIPINPAVNVPHLAHQIQRPPRMQPMRPMQMMPGPGGQVPIGQYPHPMAQVPSSGGAMPTMAGQRPQMAASTSRNLPGTAQPRAVASPWSEHCAPNGRKYYYNSRTKESKWEKPAEMLAAEASAAESDWKEYQSADGKKYYYNRVTRESKWYLPDTKPKPAVASQPQGTSGKPAVQVVKLDTSASMASGQNQENGMGKSQGMDSRNDSGSVTKLSAHDAKSLEEKKAIFRKLLVSIGCGPDWTWEQTMRLAAQDKDKRYGVLKTLADRKACFYEYQEEIKHSQREGKLQAEKWAREAFIQMLEENPEISHATRFSRVKELLVEDPRWQSVDERLRETYFVKHMRECQDKENKEKKAERKSKMTAFRELLKRNNVKVTTTWRKVSSRLEGHDEFEALDRSERLDVFQDYIKELEHEEQELKLKSEQETRRKERKNRDAFKDLLKRHRESGVINAKSRWKEYGAYVQNEEAYIAVSKNKSGSRPRELFEDIIEELEEVYNKDRGLMKEIYKKSDIVVAVTTTLDSFMEAMKEEDSRMANCQKSNVKLIYEELHAKAKEKETKEIKRKKKVRDDFASELKRCRTIKEATTWEEAQTMLENVEIKPEEEVELQEVFEEYISKLKKKEERRKKKESSPDSSSEDHKQRSHKRHKRRHSDSADDNGHKRHHRSKRHHSDSEDEDRKRSKRSKKEKGKEREKGRDRERERKHRDHRDKDREIDRRLKKGRSPSGPDASQPRDINGQSDQSHSENDAGAAAVRQHHASDVVVDSDEQPSEIKRQRSTVVAASPEDGETGEGLPKPAEDSKDGSDAEEGEVEA